MAFGSPHALGFSSATTGALPQDPGIRGSSGAPTHMEQVDVSREVPPPADEAGGAETHQGSDFSEFDDLSEHEQLSDDDLPGHVDSDSEEDTDCKDIKEWVRKLQPEIEHLSDQEVNKRLVDRLLSRKSVAFNTRVEAAEGATVGFHRTPGYETYVGLGWYGVLVQG